MRGVFSRSETIERQGRDMFVIGWLSIFSFSLVLRQFSLSHQFCMMTSSRCFGPLSKDAVETLLDSLEALCRPDGIGAFSVRCDW